MEIKCFLKDVVIERGNGFRLSIPDLAIPFQNTSFENNSSTNKLPLMGESGAGKSTLLNLMSAMEWPHKGTISWSFPEHPEIEWNFRGLSNGNARKLRRTLFGYAFQDSTLIPHLNVLDNLCYPLLLKGCSPKDAKETAKKAFEKVLLETEKNNIHELLPRFPSKLSGGQRQRVALVQALIHDPLVLFADEPTGSLDISTRRQVMRVLYDWADDPVLKNKRLLIWVTHHEDDPSGAKVEKFLKIQSGSYEWIDLKGH